MKKITIFILLAFLLAFGATPAYAQPALPHAFYGNVTINDVPAPVGTIVSASCTGGGGSIVTTQIGMYGSPIPFEPKLVVQGDINPGATITFYVTNANGTAIGGTAIYLPGGGPTEVNLSVTIYEPPVQYALIVSSTAGGSVTTPGEGSFTYNEGSIVSLVASPIAGYQFVSWTGNVSTVANANNPTTAIIMNGNYIIYANFEAIPVTYYTLTMAVNGSGSTSPAAGTHIYAAGTVAPIIATPGSGWQFVNWIGAVASPYSATTTVTMDSDKTVTANFEAIPVVQYELTISSSSGGSVTTPGEGTFTYDESDVVSLVATPNPGNQFVNWTGNVGTVANVNDPTTTITINADNSITANFEAEPEPPPEEGTPWDLIGGIISVIAFILLILFFWRRRRA